MKQVQFAATLENISTKKDKSLKVVIETAQEMMDDDAATLFSYRQKVGYITFTPQSVDTVEVPKEQIETGQKSRSQRLRGVLYVLWEQRGKKGNFEDFYQSQLEKLIEYIKEKLE